MKELIRWAEGNGWRVQRRTRHGHLVLQHRTGATITMSYSPSDNRGVKNARADMRRELRRLGQDPEETGMQGLRKRHP